MKRKILSIILCLVLCLSFAPTVNVSAANIASGTGWYIDGSGCLHITGAVNNPTEMDLGSYIDMTPWIAYKDEIVSVVAETGAYINNGALLFSECLNLVSVDISKLGTSSATSMMGMFEDCYKLKSVKLGVMNTTNVTDMSYMFGYCRSLTSLDLKCLDTLKVKNMYGMFTGCTSLKTLDVSSFKTPKVTLFNEMFKNCKNLEALDMHNFDFSSMVVADEVFEGCDSLKQLCINKSVTSALASDIRANHSTWVNAKNNIVCSKNDLMLKALADNTTIIAVVDTDAGAGAGTGWRIEKDGTFVFFGVVENPSVYNTSKNSFDDDTPWKEYKSEIKKVIATSGASLNNGISLFLGCKNLTSADLTNLNTSSVKNMMGLFMDCSSLQTVKMSSLDTSNVEYMNLLFDGCESLTSVDINGIDTSKVEEMYGMFENCKTLKKLDISDIKVANLSFNFFTGCTSLNEITTSDNSREYLADQLLILHPYWKDKATGKVCETPEDFWKFTGKATFVRTTKPLEKTCNVLYRTHVQSFGWQNFVQDGAVSGTFGLGKRLEGINIKLDTKNCDLGIIYTTHCQTYGWLPWSSNGDMNGTEGEAKRLEAIEIKLTGADKDKFDVCYRVHAQSYGWLGWAKNGEPAGTAGYGKRLEGIQIVVVKKGEKIPEIKVDGIIYSGGKAFYAKDGASPIVNYPATSNLNPVIPGEYNTTVTYRTHVQSIGWQGWKFDGQMSGTSGMAKRLEGIEIKLNNKQYSGGITYRTHVQSYGWQAWKNDGDMAGTSGEAKRLEAIEIKLTGEMANKYDIYYRVHAQSYGWLGWAKNGESSGTAGYGKRLEGIQIVLVKKGSGAPAGDYFGITSVDSRPYIEKK